jgi:hypothetical protein
VDLIAIGLKVAELRAMHGVSANTLAEHEIECISHIPAMVITMFIKRSLMTGSNGRPVTIEGQL